MKFMSILFLLSLFIFSCKDNQKIKFALFSDTHLAENTTGAADLSLAVADINLRNDLDFVLVSGDITDLNIGNHLEHAKQILDNLDIRYYIIPGNHDTKWSGSAGANFRSLWGDDKFVFDAGGYRFIGFHQGPVLRMDDGHIPGEVLTWLQNQLNQTGKDTPVILLMHYALTPSVDNWDKCAAIIRNYNIKAIIHGHGHRSRLRDYLGIPGIMGRSTLRAKEDRGGYNIFELDRDSLLVYEYTTGNSDGKKWVGISIQHGLEIQPVADSLLPDYSINKLYPNIKVSWLFPSGNTMTATPVSDGNLAYIGDVSGTMYALTLESGALAWKYRDANAIYGTAAVHGDRLVFTSADSNIYCLNSNDGSLVWKRSTGNALVSVPVIQDDRVYIGASDSVFRALDLRNGEVIWEFDQVGSFVETRPLLYQGKVIFGAWDGCLYALNQITGKPEWIWTGENTSPLYSPAAVWPVAAQGKVFITAPDRYMSAIDAQSGTTIWRNNQWKFRETIGLSTDKRSVYGRSMTDSLIAFDTGKPKSETIWAENFNYGYDIAPSMPVEKEGVLFWGTKNGLITAADASNGAIIWQYKFQNYLINTVTPINKNKLLFSNIDGNVALITSVIQ